MIVGHSCHISHWRSPEMVLVCPLHETSCPDDTADAPWPATRELDDAPREEVGHS